MNRTTIGFLAGIAIGGVIGIAAGAGGMLVAFPFLFPPPAVNETVAAMAGRDVAVLQETRFREGTAGQDAAHWGRGGVRTYRSDDGDVLIELQPDFEVGPGPNFWVYLNTRRGIDDEADFEADEGRQRIARLKSFTGSQVYRADADAFAAAGAVTIWCESFGQYIASADL
ncbi:MAG: DM13 domain-containing protein [Gammaproteobacteria bacterium]|nr:DM13 domain-containing protein [Gammaproteobacteria bacterium]